LSINRKKEIQLETLIQNTMMRPQPRYERKAEEKERAEQQYVACFHLQWYNAKKEAASIQLC
jgi:hypothetical protein